MYLCTGYTYIYIIVIFASMIDALCRPQQLMETPKVECGAVIFSLATKSLRDGIRPQVTVLPPTNLGHLGVHEQRDFDFHIYLWIPMVFAFFVGIKLKNHVKTKSISDLFFPHVVSSAPFFLLPSHVQVTFTGGSKGKAGYLKTSETWGNIGLFLPWVFSSAKTIPIWTINNNNSNSNNNNNNNNNNIDNREKKQTCKTWKWSYLWSMYSLMIFRFWLFNLHVTVYTVVMYV